MTKAHFTFQQLPAERTVPENFTVPAGFSHVIIAGVLAYLNDEQVTAALRGVVRCCAPGALVYLREPIAHERRLTLVEHFSEDLNATYNAIYRTREEILEYTAEMFGSAGLSLTADQQLYPSNLNNRSETYQRFFLFRRGQ